MTKRKRSNIPLTSRRLCFSATLPSTRRQWARCLQALPVPASVIVIVVRMFFLSILMKRRFRPRQRRHSPCFVLLSESPANPCRPPSYSKNKVRIRDRRIKPVVPSRNQYLFETVPELDIYLCRREALPFVRG